MNAKSFNERAKALENLFYQQVDHQLLETMRNELAEQEAKEALRTASGISNEEVLTELVHIEVAPATLAAVSLIPLVAIAWADGKVTEAERESILTAEAEANITKDSPCHQLLIHWLESNPGDELLETWTHFVHELRGKLSEVTAVSLDKDLIARVQAVAQASGGYWSYGSVSPTEHKVLAKIKKTLRDVDAA